MAMLDVWSQYPDYDGYRYSDEYYWDKEIDDDIAEESEWTEDDIPF